MRRVFEGQGPGRTLPFFAPAASSGLATTRTTTTKKGMTMTETTTTSETTQRSMLTVDARNLNAVDADADRLHVKRCAIIVDAGRRVALTTTTSGKRKPFDVNATLLASLLTECGWSTGTSQGTLSKYLRDADQPAEKNPHAIGLTIADAHTIASALRELDALTGVKSQKGKLARMAAEERLTSALDPYVESMRTKRAADREALKERRAAAAEQKKEQKVRDILDAAPTGVPDQTSDAPAESDAPATLRGALVTLTAAAAGVAAAAAAAETMTESERAVILRAVDVLRDVARAEESAPVLVS